MHRGVCIAHQRLHACIGAPVVDRVLHERVAGRARQQQGGRPDVLHLQERTGDADATADVPDAGAVRVEPLERDRRADHRRASHEHSHEACRRQACVRVQKQEMGQLAAEMESRQNGVARAGDQAFVADRVELELDSRFCVFE